MSKCNKCNGSGRIANPRYSEEARALDSQYESGYLPYPLYERRVTEIFGSFEALPDEFLTCPECRGSGRALAGLQRAYHGA